jgi:hypothetical protein
MAITINGQALPVLQVTVNIEASTPATEEAARVNVEIQYREPMQTAAPAYELRYDYARPEYVIPTSTAGRESQFVRLSPVPVTMDVAPEDTFDDTLTPEDIANIEAGLEDIRQGRVYSHEETRRFLFGE